MIKIAPVPTKARGFLFVAVIENYLGLYGLLLLLRIVWVIAAVDNYREFLIITRRF